MALVGYEQGGGDSVDNMQGSTPQAFQVGTAGGAVSLGMKAKRERNSLEGGAERRKEFSLKLYVTIPSVHIGLKRTNYGKEKIQNVSLKYSELIYSLANMDIFQIR